MISQSVAAMTIYAKLIAMLDDCGYINYVFKDIEKETLIMCTRYPNWNQKQIKLGDEGFLEYKEIIAGETTWYNSSNNDRIPYKYDGLQFVKFIHKPDNINENTEYTL